jgi:hypothetical protein
LIGSSAAAHRPAGIGGGGGANKIYIYMIPGSLSLAMRGGKTRKGEGKGEREGREGGAGVRMGGTGRREGQEGGAGRERRERGEGKGKGLSPPKSTFWLRHCS